jgi:hypothetical protein
LAGFQNVLKDDGFAHIIVPDMHEVMRQTLERGLDIDDILYQSPAGPIMVLDVIYGYSAQIEKSGVEFYAHKTGFTQKSLVAALNRAGFAKIYTGLDQASLEIHAWAFKNPPSDAARALFQLPAG